MQATPPRHPFFRRSWQHWAASLGCIAAGAFLTFHWPRRNGLDVDFDPTASAQSTPTNEPYDLTELAVINRAILEVKDHYVDPTRVRPRRMFLAALNAIQRSVAPVIVRYETGAPRVSVQVNGDRQEFDVESIDSPWTLAGRFRDAFAFLQARLDPNEVKLRDVEYAAVNGMLSTLDPHSVLLTAEGNEDMRMATRGEFGGLGIVISIRNGQLTVIKPMPNTPASRAGLLRMDRIVQINDESTLNMPVTEAANRLRGAPGSRVSVYIVREGAGGWERPRPFELVRAVIHIESIESRMLGDGVGYVKILNFRGNTAEDLREALDALGAQGLRALVMDLRDNPGGLLDQAVEITDMFLKQGTIVTTSSNDPSERDEKFARDDGNEPTYPMAVLVNDGSASASEIVAGALKNHDRAVVIGRRTFGKGSVQVLYDLLDGSALKLTIAQYLTPGDVSIQEVGIVPDIAVDPMTADPIDMDLEIDGALIREADLHAHLTHAAARDATRSTAPLRYYLPVETRRMLLDATPEDQPENTQEDEFLLRFSRQLLAQATRSGRRELLAGAQAILQQTGDAEMARAVAELRRLGVDWSIGDDRGPSDVRVEVTTSAGNEPARAGDPLDLRVRVTNMGSAPLYQLRAVTKSDYPLFDGRELVFGRLAPGQSAQWSTTLGLCETQQARRVCTLPRSTLDRADAVRVEFREQHGHIPAPAQVRTTIRALPRPQFAYSVQIADDARGNGDGRVQRGEQATVYVRLKNTGVGQTFDLQANLRNLSGAGILLRRGRFPLNVMEPGAETTIGFTFDVLPEFVRNALRLEVSIVDMQLRESVGENIEVPIADASAASVTSSARSVLVPAGTELRDQPRADGGPVAAVAGGPIALTTQAALGEWTRVDLDTGRPGWVPTASLLATGPRATGTLSWHLDHMPPVLDVQYGSANVTTQDRLHLTGRVRDERHVRDVYVFVGARKVYYRAIGPGERDVSFEADLPLQGGLNYVSVFARESDDVVSRSTFVVRRDGPDGSLLERPTGEEFGESEEE